MIAKLHGDQLRVFFAHAGGQLRWKQSGQKQMDGLR